MRGNFVNLCFKAFNKQSSSLIGLKPTIAYFTYNLRWWLYYDECANAN